MSCELDRLCWIAGVLPTLALLSGATPVRYTPGAGRPNPSRRYRARIRALDAVASARLPWGDDPIFAAGSILTTLCCEDDTCDL